MYPIIYFLAQNRCVASEIAGPVDVFNTANLLIENIEGKDAEKLRWKIVTVDGKPVSNTMGMEFKADMSLDEVQAPGWLYVPGVMYETEEKLTDYLEVNNALMKKLKSFESQQISFAANCTGTFVLAEAGILNGKQATTTWWLADFFQRRYPAVDLKHKQLITDNENVVCSGTATAHLELSLLLVHKMLGPKYAHLCSKYLLIENRHKSQAAYQSLTKGSSKEPFIQAAKNYLLARLNQEIRIDDLAATLAVSNRTLIRRFNKYTGDSPQKYLQKLRIERSKHLLESSKMSSSDVMYRVGYQDSSTFRRLFKRYTGLTPVQYREKYAVKSH